LDPNAPILCFGEVLLRLAPPLGTRLSEARSFSPHVAGAEANVAAALAQLGHAVQFVTVLPEGPLGDLCAGELRRAGVGTETVLRAPGRLGLYWLDPALLPRTARIVYDRANSVFCTDAAGFDWPTLARNARRLHLSGISLAVSAAAAEACRAAVRAMAEAGVPISFDANHRPSLWEGREQEAIRSTREMMEAANILFASPHDLSRLLARDIPHATHAERRAAAEAAFEAFPHVRLVGWTMRDAARRTLAARVDSRDEGHETEPVPLGAVIDRIGSGDAFAAGVLDAARRDAAPEECARFGLAAAVLKHGIAGDRWIGTREELEGFDPAGGGEVRR
jgi:2-dehydro-3-deoxygluconokinase